MSSTARKARKRARARFVKPTKTRTRDYRPASGPRGIGLITGPEILARILARRA